MTVTGQLDELLTRLLDEVEEKETHGDWLSLWQGLNAQALSLIDSAAPEQLWEGHVASACIRQLQDGDYLHVSNSMPIRDLDAYTPNLGTDITVSCNRGVNGIDGQIATALGAVAALPAAQSILLIGDLAFRHDAHSLALCQDASITIVILDNGGGQIFRHLPIAEHPNAFESVFLTPSTVQLEGLCAAYELRYTRVDTVDALSAALRSELGTNDAGAIVVDINPADNHAIHLAITEAAQSLNGQAA